MWNYFLGWYHGAVWSNLLASAMWFIPGYMWGRFHMKKIHGKVQDIHDHLNPKKDFTIGCKDDIR